MHYNKIKNRSPNQPKKGAGILPMCYYNNEWLILCGREREFSKEKDSGKWSDFGGGAEKHEATKAVAIRECYEESMGIFGNKLELRELIEEKCLTIIDTGTYECFVVEIEYSKDLPKFFQISYNYIYNEDKSYLKKKNGLFEKDKIQWLKLREVIDNRNINTTDVELHFRKIFIHVLKLLKREMNSKPLKFKPYRTRTT